VRQVQQPLNVTTDTQGNPSRLEGPRRPVAVRRVLDAWRYGGRWWIGESPRDYYLLELETGHVFEVFCSEGRWTLSRVAD